MMTTTMTILQRRCRPFGSIPFCSISIHPIGKPNTVDNFVYTETVAVMSYHPVNSPTTWMSNPKVVPSWCFDPTLSHTKYSIHTTNDWPLWGGSYPLALPSRRKRRRRNNNNKTRKTTCRLFPSPPHCPFIQTHFKLSDNYAVRAQSSLPNSNRAVPKPTTNNTNNRDSWVTTFSFPP